MPSERWMWPTLMSWLLLLVRWIIRLYSQIGNWLGLFLFEIVTTVESVIRIPKNTTSQCPITATLQLSQMVTVTTATKGWHLYFVTFWLWDDHNFVTSVWSHWFLNKPNFFKKEMATVYIQTILKYMLQNLGGSRQYIRYHWQNYSAITILLLVLYNISYKKKICPVEGFSRIS